MQLAENKTFNLAAGKSRLYIPSVPFSSVGGTGQHEQLPDLILMEALVAQQIFHRELHEAHSAYKIVFVQNTLILTPESDATAFLKERAEYLGSLIRGHLLHHRHQLQSRLARTGSIRDLALTLERILGMPITLAISDLEKLLTGERHARPNPSRPPHAQGT